MQQLMLYLLVFLVLLLNILNIFEVMYHPTLTKVLWTLGKSPLFEVRQMDVEPKKSLKFTTLLENKYPQEPELVNNEGLKAEINSDEDENHLSDSDKVRTGKSVNKKSSTIYVYTYKVKLLGLPFYIVFVIHISLSIVLCRYDILCFNNLEISASSSSSCT